MDAMTVSPAVADSWHRVNIYKFLAGVVCILIVLQYLLSSALDRRSIDTFFTINTSRPPHQRAFVIYESQSAATSASGTAVDDVDDAIAVASVLSSSPGNNASSNNSQLASTSMPKLGVNSSNSPPLLTDEAQQQQHQRHHPQAVSTNTMSPPVTNSNALCPPDPPNLVGPIAVSISPPDLAAMEKAFTKVKQGGQGAPENCQARYRVAIVIPFRDRFQHLMTLLYNLHPLLQRQQLDYQIFVVEQEGTVQFNRAMLMNVGFVEALKERSFDCFIFHDVDLLPEDDRNVYNCSDQPRHMSVAVDKFHYKLPYNDLFGGVSAMRTEQFRLVNGFSNVFWGWGGEDDDMANRLKSKGLHISRYPVNIARYKMLTHKKEKANPKRFQFLKTGKNRFQTDGLNNLQYEILEKKKTKLYTSILVRLTPPSQPS